jgi:hypothetical protein
MPQLGLFASSTTLYHLYVNGEAVSIKLPSEATFADLAAELQLDRLSLTDTQGTRLSSTARVAREIKKTSTKRPYCLRGGCVPQKPSISAVTTGRSLRGTSAPVAMSITVKTLYGSDLQIYVNADDTVDEVKERIHQLDGADPPACHIGGWLC